MLPVVVGLAFVFRTAGIAMQEVVIALAGDAGKTAGSWAGSRCASAPLHGRPGRGRVHPPGLGLVRTVSGLSRTSAFAILPGRLARPPPLPKAVLSYQRGVFVQAHRTAPISVAVAVQLAVTSLVFALMVMSLKTVLDFLAPECS